MIFALIWLGVIYGALDGVFLTVMPVLATQRMFTKLSMSYNLTGRLIGAVIALAASLLVTATYHWGYTEFRGPEIIEPLIGNAIITLGYLLITNPSTPVVAHVAMHIAAVLHGMETTIQLPRTTEGNKNGYCLFKEVMIRIYLRTLVGIGKDSYKNIAEAF